MKTRITKASETKGTLKMNQKRILTILNKDKQQSSCSNATHGEVSSTSSIPQPASIEIPKEINEKCNASRGFAFLLNNNKKDVKRKLATETSFIDIDLTEEDQDENENEPPRKRQKQGKLKNAYG